MPSHAEVMLRRAVLRIAVLYCCELQHEKPSSPKSGKLPFHDSSAPRRLVCFPLGSSIHAREVLCLLTSF